MSLKVMNFFTCIAHLLHKTSVQSKPFSDKMKLDFKCHYLIILLLANYIHCVEDNKVWHLKLFEIYFMASTGSNNEGPKGTYIYFGG